MSLYSLALFVHVSGAIGAFANLGIWLFGLAALRRARLVEQVRALAMLLLSIVFLMTTKPELVTSILVMGVALFLGLFISLPFWMARRRRARQPGDHLPGTQADPFLKQTSIYKAMVE